MTKPPFIPRSPTNPIGQTDRQRRVKEAVNKRLRRAEARILREWDRIPVQVQNGRLRNQAFYEYLISIDALEAIVRFIASSLEDVGQDILADQVRQAYREGTSKAVDNLSRISDDYTRTITEVLASRPYARRAALAAARVFELMDGFSGDAAADLSRIIFQAVQDGVNPSIVSKQIRDRFGVHRRRADRIARTELNMAQRRGRWDEARDAQEKFGLEVRLIHYSALQPDRTRATHAARHGRIYTVEAQAEWYARDGNSNSCLCSNTEVTVDSDGKPLTGGKLLERMEEQRKRFNLGVE